MTRYVYTGLRRVSTDSPKILAMGFLTLGLDLVGLSGTTMNNFYTSSQRLRLCQLKEKLLTYLKRGDLLRCVGVVLPPRSGGTYSCLEKAIIYGGNVIYLNGKHEAIKHATNTA